MKITFRSDRESDFAHLEQHLTAGSFGNLPDAWRHQAQHDIERLRKAMGTLSSGLPWVTDELRAQLAEFDDLDLPTRYDSPTQFRILGKLISRVKAAAELMGLETTMFPHFSCIPTGLVNASAVAIPNVSRPFLLFDSELFLFCHLFAKAFAQCLPVIGRDEMLSLSVDIELVKKRIHQVPALTERFADLLSAYSITGSPSQSKQYNPEVDYVHLIDILRDGMELFVVAHEFGHVYSGHLGGVLQRLGLREKDLLGENPSHRQEHEADLIGMVLTLQVMSSSGYDAGLAYAGVELFFVSLEMVGRARHIVLHGTDEGYVDAASASHPSSGDRRILLRESLGTFIAEEEQAGVARKMAATYTEIAELLWNSARTANPSFQWAASGGR